MDASPPRRALPSILAFVGVGIALTTLGLMVDQWWPIAGGTAAIACACWIATEPAR